MVLKEEKFGVFTAQQSEEATALCDGILTLFEAYSSQPGATGNVLVVAMVQTVIAFVTQQPEPERALGMLVAMSRQALDHHLSTQEKG